METKYFSLGPVETNTIVKIIRILFGLVCIVIAAFWMIFNVRAARADRALWITVIFLTGFGMYQIWAGFGRASRFIQTGSDKILLKKNSFLPVKEIKPSEVKKIEFYPLNLIFYYHKGGKTILRFGTIYADSIDPVKREIEEFSSVNNIEIETIREEI
jgi:hypothetical protein